MTRFLASISVILILLFSLNTEALAESTITATGRVGPNFSDGGQSRYDPCSICGKCAPSRSTCRTCGYELSYSHIHCTTCNTLLDINNFCGYCHPGPIYPPESAKSTHAADCSWWTHSGYGYRGKTQTFTVYDINLTSDSKTTPTVTVTGATITTAAIPGKTVTIDITSTVPGVKHRVAINGVNNDLDVGTLTDSFTMPSEDLAVSVSALQSPQTVTASIYPATAITYNTTTSYKITASVS